MAGFHVSRGQGPAEPVPGRGLGSRGAVPRGRPAGRPFPEGDEHTRPPAQRPAPPAPLRVWPCHVAPIPVLISSSSETPGLPPPRGRKCQPPHGRLCSPGAAPPPAPRVLPGHRVVRHHVTRSSHCVRDGCCGDPAESVRGRPRHLPPSPRSWAAHPVSGGWLPPRRHPLSSALLASGLRTSPAPLPGGPPPRGTVHVYVGALPFPVPVSLPPSYTLREDQLSTPVCHGFSGPTEGCDDQAHGVDPTAGRTTWEKPSPLGGPAPRRVGLCPAGAGSLGPRRSCPPSPQGARPCSTGRHWGACTREFGEAATWPCRVSWAGSGRKAPGGHTEPCACAGDPEPARRTPATRGCPLPPHAVPGFLLLASAHHLAPWKLLPTQSHPGRASQDVRPWVTHNSSSGWPHGQGLDTEPSPRGFPGFPCVH